MKPLDIKILINDIEYKPLRNADEILRDLSPIMGIDPFEEFTRIFIESLTEDREIFRELIYLSILSNPNGDDENI